MSFDRTNHAKAISGQQPSSDATVGAKAMTKDIFASESKILSEAKTHLSNEPIRSEIYAELVSNYGKLLRTTKKIIKLSDKNEDKLNELKSEAVESSAKLQSISSQLSKFLSPQLYDSIFSGSRAGTRATRRKKLTVFFSDLCGFTDFVESVESEDVTHVLNLYLETMTNIALHYGATIDKYIGDGIMLFFGDPETQGEREDARACVEMALKMQERMVQLKKKWQKEGFADPFQVRIGINTGYCNVGNFGSDQRLTYTIIGGEVNVAQRLEAGADADGILLSYESYAHAKDMIEVEERQAIKMKGIYREIKIFSVIDRKTNASKIIEGSTGKSELNILTDSKPDLVRRVKNIEENTRNINIKIR